jgi:hypothetical protein
VRRSFTSTGGVNFQLLDAVSPDVAGSLAIRAVATLGN